MFNMNVKTKFIEMKAAGLPMYKIANELGVHRATIMRWNKELAPYILIARQDAIDEILLENGCMRINRIEKISKMLALYYAGLEINETEKAGNIEVILDRITKLTKLLMIETNAKSPEKDIKSDEDFLCELSGEEADFDATVWVTDKEKFNRYEPDEETLDKPQEELKEFADDIVKRKMENYGFINSDPATVQEISEKDPELQKVFSSTFIRKAGKEHYKTEKCDNNVTMKAKDIKLRKKE